MPVNSPDVLLVMVVFLAIGFVPLIALVATSYLKIAVVLGLLRSAMGTQQVPPNLVTSAIALSLTVFIMAPVFTQISASVAEDKTIDFRRVTPAGLSALVDRVQQPMAAFLKKHTPESDREFFSKAAAEMWQGQETARPAADSLLLLVPAFTVRELTRAFQIGFILYLAFIAVDLVVANVIQAFGLSMLSPTPIAIPFKLLLFVAFDGWQKLIYALVLSYR